MAAKLTIRLLGNAEVRRDQQNISAFRSQKALALLAYLAHTAGTTYRREALADLLWDARSTKQSLSNLRTVLTQLRKEVADNLTISNRSLAFDQASDYWLDTAALQTVLATELESTQDAGKIQNGLQLYRGAFLDGLYFADAPRFNEWAMLERERLHLGVIDRYRQLADFYLESGDYRQGIIISEGWLALDILDEAAHRYRMQVLALDGQRSRALAQYEQAAHILREELGIEPDTATTSLYGELRNGAPADPTRLEESKPVKPSAPGLGPLPATVRSTKPIIGATNPDLMPSSTSHITVRSARNRLAVIAIVLVSLIAVAAFMLLRDDEPTGSGVISKVCFNAESPTLEPGFFSGDAWLGVLEGARKFDAEAVAQHDFPRFEMLTQEDYREQWATNLAEILTQDCDLVIANGFTALSPFAEVARSNPDTRFMLLDGSYDEPIGNIWGQVYAVDEAAFMAGYVAASLTQTGKVGTFGGFHAPSVVPFMDGFARGVAHYNQQKGVVVEVLGWDVETRTGLFANSFWVREDGYPATRQLIEEGADIILPVAGIVGFGAADIVLQHENVYVIGVDSDWGLHHPEYADVVLTSIEKRWNISILSALDAVEQGEFEGGTHIGDLENGEVGLAPFREFDALISEAVARDLVQVRADIITGRVQTRPQDE